MKINYVQILWGEGPSGSQTRRRAGGSHIYSRVGMSPERVTPARVAPARRRAPPPQVRRHHLLLLLSAYSRTFHSGRRLLARCSHPRRRARHFRLRVSLRERTCAAPPPRRSGAVRRRGRGYLSRMLSPLPNAGRAPSELEGARDALLQPLKMA